MESVFREVTNSMKHILPEKLGGRHLLKKCPASYATHKFITAFTYSYPEPDKSTPGSPIPFPKNPF